MLAGTGFRVRTLAVTASEGAQRLHVGEHLRSLGIEFSLERGHSRKEFRFLSRGIEFRLLDTGALGLIKWESALGRQFDLMLDEELRTFQPDVVFTYGGSPGDDRRRARARKAGAKVVFGLRNEGYLVKNAFTDVDAILTPSRYLSERYREAIGVESAPLPTPMVAEDIVAPEHDPIFLTFVNPSFEKGVVVFAQLAEELSKQRPDLPILVIESRGSAGLLAAVGENGGFDLRRHENIMFSPAVPTPRDVYVPTRVLAVPSLRDAAPRVIAEAMTNGIPPLVSDRCGLPEMAEGAGCVFPLPLSLSLSDRAPVSAEVVQPWIELIVRHFDEEEFYAAECSKARNAAKRFSPEVLAPQYANFFFAVIARA